MVIPRPQLGRSDPGTGPQPRCAGQLTTATAPDAVHVEALQCTLPLPVWCRNGPSKLLGMTPPRYSCIHDPMHAPSERKNQEGRVAQTK